VKTATKQPPSPAPSPLREIRAAVGSSMFDWPRIAARLDAHQDPKRSQSNTAVRTLAKIAAILAATPDDAIDWKAAALELARCVDFTLRHYKHLGGSGMMIDLAAMRAGKPTSVRRWQEDFFDALALLGVEYDRAGYYASLGKKKRGRAS